MTTKHKHLVIIVALLSLVGMTACINRGVVISETTEPSAPPTPHATEPVTVGISDTPQPDLAGTSWEMTSVNGRAAVDGTRVTATFDNEGTITGSGGCNTYTYAYETTPPNFINVEPGITTLMACEPAITNQETQYFRALDDAATYVADGETLTLTSADGSTTVSYQAMQEATLAGTSWIVTGYNNGKQAVVSVLAETTLTADFHEDGTLSGSAGCNNYNSTFTVDGSDITISPPASTMMACAEPNGIMEQEAAYLAAIQTAVTYQINGDNMELRDAEGALAATFTTGPELSLTDITWQVVTYNDNNQGIVPPLPNTTLTAQFSADGTVTGETGCGQFTASYQVNGSEMSIGQPEVMRAGSECNEDQGVQETEYTNALATAATFSLQNGQLQILNEAGNEAVTFSGQ